MSLGSVECAVAFWSRCFTCAFALCVTLVAEEQLSKSDSILRLGHYVTVLENDWTSVDKSATELRNDLDETLEVQRVIKFVSEINLFVSKLSCCLSDGTFLSLLLPY